MLHIDEIKYLFGIELNKDQYYNNLRWQSWSVPAVHGYSASCDVKV